MRTIDFDYIADQIANMTRIPVRVIRNDAEGEPRAALYSDFGFTVDPAMPYLPDLCRIPEPCAYYLAPSGNQCFGVISSPQAKLILGPTWQMRPTRQELREYLFLLGIPRAEQPSYLEKLASITPLPLNLFLHELSMIYYFITEKKLDLSDIFLYGGHGEHTVPPVSAAAEQPEQMDSGVWQEPDSGSANTAYEFEKKMLRLITDGSPDGLMPLFSKYAAGRTGRMAPTYLRQCKDEFITTCTLATRAAIAGGLPESEAFALSDQYIQHCEAYGEPERISNLQYHMILDFADKVREIRNGRQYDRFLRTAAAYVRDHITESISVEDAAAAAGLSRSRFSVRFHEETGQTFSAFVRHQKIEKAKDYLRHTDRSILEISTYLGFSSQGHFQNIFRQDTGMTPGQYRKQ